MRHGGPLRKTFLSLPALGLLLCGPPAAALCGDLVVGEDEQCDDGNGIPCDGCSPFCLIETPPRCGDGVHEACEACDDGNLTDGDGCDSNCRPTGCGNAIVTTGEQCDDGNPFIGDGCAPNCTTETRRLVRLDPERSAGNVYTTLFTLPFTLSGTVTVTTGGASSNGSIPAAIRASDIRIDPVAVPGLVCTCVRGIPRPEFGTEVAAAGAISCGGTVRQVNSVTFQDHRIGVVGRCAGGLNAEADCTADSDCPGGQCFDAADCALAGGGVESGGGVCEENRCLDGPRSRLFCLDDVPCNDPHAGTCYSAPTIRFEGSGTPGSVGATINVAVSLIPDGGTCSEDPTDITKGPDGMPCNDDDPDKGIPVVVPISTGTASAQLLHPGADPNAEPLRAQLTGRPFNCARILANPTGGLEDGIIVTVFPNIDLPVPGGLRLDSIAAVQLVPLREVTATPTATLSPTPSETALPAETASPTKAPSPTVVPCSGDCNGDAVVTVDELVLAVNIALGSQSVSACSAIDGDGNGSAEINELVSAVGHALNGCGSFNLKGLRENHRRAPVSARS